MSNWLNDVATVTVVIACCLLLLQRARGWKHRFRAIGSPLLGSPTYRALFLLVLVGVLLIATVPEAAFALPALDAVGLDLVTILVALELRHYLASVARLVRIPNPRLWPYTCMWVVIWIRTLKGTMTASPPPAQI
jgi:hypothetical protein